MSVLILNISTSGMSAIWSGLFGQDYLPLTSARVLTPRSGNPDQMVPYGQEREAGKPYLVRNARSGKPTSEAGKPYLVRNAKRANLT